MTSRPEILFPLHRSLTTLEGIGPSIEKKMKGLLIDKPVDLLFTLPISFIQRKLVDTVFMYPSGKYVIVEVSILKHQPGRTKQSAYKVTVQDKEVSFNLLFFHARKDYLNKIINAINNIEVDRDRVLIKLKFYQKGQTQLINFKNNDISYILSVSDLDESQIMKFIDDNAKQAYGLKDKDICTLINMASGSINTIFQRAVRKWLKA